MTRRQNDPLRTLTGDERRQLEHLSRAQSAPAAQVTRAKLVLVVANGKSYLEAAQSVGRRSNDAVAHLVFRFNCEGLAALAPRHGGGPAVVYGPAERERILGALQRPPDHQRDGTATWSLTTLHHALRTAPAGVPHISTFPMLAVLHDTGLSWQRDRSWCETGTVVRKRKAGLVQVTDPDTEPTKP